MGTVNSLEFPKARKYQRYMSQLSFLQGIEKHFLKFRTLEPGLLSPLVPW